MRELKLVGAQYLLDWHLISGSVYFEIVGSNAFFRIFIIIELYGKPSWWGDDNSEDEGVGEDKGKSPSHPLSAQPSRKMSFNDLRPDSPTGQGELPTFSQQMFTLIIIYK